MTIRTLYTAGGLLLLPAVMFAQLSSYVSSTSPSSTPPRKPVTVTVELQPGHRITGVRILYRPFGSSSWRKGEMDLRGNTARFTVTKEYALAPFFEYYLVLTDASGKMISHPPATGGDPIKTPPAQPLRVTVADEDKEQVLFLSPEPDALLEQDDVLISISLLRADSAVVRKATQIKVDDINVTTGAVFSEDLIVYAPENHGLTLAPGTHTVKVGLFNRKGQLYATAELSFTVRGQGRDVYGTPAPVRGFDYKLDMNVESRHEQIRSEGTWYNRAGATFRGKTGIWGFTSNIFLTSDERSDRQPQHRFFAGVETPWVQVGYGDHYPVLPELVLSGKRVRGLSGSAHYGIFGVDMTLGQITRGVEGKLVRTFAADSFSVEFHRDSTAAYGQVTPGTFGRFNYGTYSRDMFAIRPRVGDRETWEVGFSWLSAGDDKNSIHYGIAPKENIVIGTDFMARIDNSRIEITGQAAASAYNMDISRGSFTDEDIDRIYASGSEGIKKVRDILGPYITVNDNFRPLNVDKLPTIAYEVGLGLNYFNNFLKFTYLYHGNDYTSFGQSFLQTDIKGFSIVDRARLIDNQVFLTLGYERLEDNTSTTKVGTTMFNNVNVAATYMSRGDLPTFTVGLSVYDNDNGLSVGGRDSLAAISDGTFRLYMQGSYEFVAGPRHTATLSLSTSNRDDKSVRQYDVQNVSAELGLTSLFQAPLRTTFSAAMFLNTLPLSGFRGQTQTLNYGVLTFAARYGFMRNLLTAAATVAPAFGDYHRIAFEAGLEWAARPDMQLLLQISFFKNSDVADESIVSLRYRYTI
jgi:hypothetical protein